MKKTNFNVEDMHCVNCAMHLQELEDILAGVESVEASYQKGKMTVVYDETKVSEAQIIGETKKLGYTARVNPGP